MKRASPLYALVLLTEVVWTAIVPLMPAYARMNGLSGLQSGAVLASAGVATLVVALPAGLLSDHKGARALVLVAATLVTVSTLTQGFSSGFWMLFSARAVFGLAFGIVWTAGIAWLAETDAVRGRPESLGLPTTVAGVALVLGPGFAGLLADATTIDVPFYVLGVAGVPVIVALLRTPYCRPIGVDREPLGETLVKTRRDGALFGSLLVMTLMGFAGGAINLVVPLQLRRDGLSPGAIGLALSGAALVFVAASAAVSRRRGSANLRVIGFAALLYATTMVVAAADTGTHGLIAFLLLRAPFWGALATLAFPLAAVGAHRAGAALGAVNGLLNLGWGAAGSAGPVIAGAVAQTLNTSGVLLALATATTAVGASLFAADRLTTSSLSSRAPL